MNTNQIQELSRQPLIQPPVNLGAQARPEANKADQTIILFDDGAQVIFDGDIQSQVLKDSNLMNQLYEMAKSNNGSIKVKPFTSQHPL
mmetsp:Transcript_18828/g.32167  ORF Transcript_18828/g.32167 Transcript_18828/m.32167 type:complete len:88 (-) Transcript_18828:53-316(-)